MPPLTGHKLESSVLDPIDDLENCRNKKNATKFSQEEQKEVDFAKKFRHFKITTPSQNSQVRYIFVDQDAFGIMWVNVILLAIMHLFFINFLCLAMTFDLSSSWIFGKLIKKTIIS